MSAEHLYENLVKSPKTDVVEETWSPLDSHTPIVRAMDFNYRGDGALVEGTLNLHMNNTLSYSCNYQAETGFECDLELEACKLGFYVGVGRDVEGRFRIKSGELETLEIFSIDHDATPLLSVSQQGDLPVPV